MKVRSITFQRWVRKLHKLIGAIVFLQLLLWMVSGLYMTSVPIDIIHGDHLVEHSPSTPLQKNKPKVSLEYLLQLYPDAHSIELINRLSNPVYRIKTAKKTLILNTETGKPLPKISETQAFNIATKSYTGEASIESITLITDYNQAPDAKGRALPLWQAEFKDMFASTFYISVDMGAIVAVRSDLWRVFDFLWMLHIMDYDEREDFNNPLVILMASLGLLLVLSGIVLVINIIQKKGFRGLAH